MLLWRLLLLLWRSGGLCSTTRRRRWRLLGLLWRSIRRERWMHAPWPPLRLVEHPVVQAMPRPIHRLAHQKVCVRAPVGVYAHEAAVAAEDHEVGAGLLGVRVVLLVEEVESELHDAPADDVFGKPRQAGQVVAPDAEV